MTASASAIRAFGPEDLAAVAALFRRIFRDGAPASANSLEQALADTFLNHPWADEATPSHVFVDDGGTVDGFLGVIPARMQIHGRPVRAAFAGSMMVGNPQANPLAGARLLRAFLSGPQDVSLSETANSTALGMWRKLGHDLLPGYSTNWLRILRPGATLAEIAGRGRGAGKLLRPFGALADKASRAIGIQPFRLDEVRGRGPEFHDTDEAGTIKALLALAPLFTLYPRWDDDVLGWLTAQAREKAMFGPIVRRTAFAPDGTPVATYIYHAEKGGIGRVLQLLARPERLEAALDDMLRHAAEAGCAALYGGGQPWLLPLLLRKKALLSGRSYMLSHTRDTEIRDAIKSDNALISGMAGENWSPLIGGRF